MSAEVTEREAQNYATLLENGSFMSTKTGLDINGTPENGDSSQPGAELTVRNLDRFTAISIARQLTNVLNGKGENREGTLKSDLDSSVERSRAQDPIVFREHPGEDFSVLVGEEDMGKFVLQAGFNNDYKSREDRRIRLNEGFRQAMQLVEVKPSDPEEDDISVESVLRRIPIAKAPFFGRASRYAQGDRLRDEDWETRSFNWDLEAARLMSRVFGLSDAETADKDELVKLWRSRNQDPIAMIDLFMYMFDDKQSIEGSRDYFPENIVINMIDAARDYDPIELRRKLEDKAIDVLQTRKIGVSEPKAKALVQKIDNEDAKLKLRYLMWVADFPVMQPVAKEIRLRLVTGGSFADLYDRTLKILAELGSQHGKDKKTSSEDLGPAHYDPRKGYHLNAHSRKLEFFKTTWILGVYIFKGEATAEKVLASLDR